MNSLTHAAEAAAVTAIVTAGASLRLYTAASTPQKDGVVGGAFVELANGNGYTTGGHAVSVSDWVQSTTGDSVRRTLPDQTWTASGAGMANIAGLMLVASNGTTVLAWWERTPPVTVASGGHFVGPSLYIG